MDDDSSYWIDYGQDDSDNDSSAEDSSSTDSWGEWTDAVSEPPPNPPAPKAPTDPALLARFIGSHPNCWYIPADAAGEWLVESVDGLRVLTIYEKRARKNAVEVRSRQLAAGAMECCDALRIVLGRHQERMLQGAWFGQLLERSKEAVMLDALKRPWPGRALLFLEQTWEVLTRNGECRALDYAREDGQAPFRFVPLFAAREWAREASEVATFLGRDLFPQLAARADIDGIVFHPKHSDSRKRDFALEVLDKEWCAAIAKGIDLRYGLASIAVRGEDDIALWLEMHRWGFGSNPKLVQRTSTLEKYQTYWQGRHVDLVFENRDPGGPPLLCAGLLLEHAAALGKELPARNRWRSRKSREQAARVARLYGDIAQLLPPGQDRLPPAALLSIEGCWYVRQHPECASRATIEAARRHAEALARRAIF